MSKRAILSEFLKMLILLIIVLLLSFGGFKLYKYIKHERLKAAHRADIYNKQGQVRILTWGLLPPYWYTSNLSSINQKAAI